MARSMTGFGRGGASRHGVTVGVEIRTVNHKHLNVQVNAPRVQSEAIHRLRSRAVNAFQRGAIQINYFVALDESYAPRVVLSRPLARVYRDRLRELEDELGDPKSRILEIIASLPGVLEVQEPEIQQDLFKELLDEAMDQAIAGVREHREAEGRILSKNLEKRFHRILELLGHVEKQGEKSALDRQNRLRKRIGELLRESAVSVDAPRLETEIALLAEKADVTEEIARIRAHVAQLRGLLPRDGAVGRRMEFLCQEIGRECNTICAKTPDARIVQEIVELRSETEKVREQVQNLE